MTSDRRSLEVGDVAAIDVDMPVVYVLRDRDRRYVMAARDSTCVVLLNRDDDGKDRTTLCKVLINSEIFWISPRNLRKIC